MEVIIKKVYKAVGCEKGHYFGTFAHFKELRESSNLSVQKTCFCCGHKFQPEDFISLACFDKGMGNKFLCQKCKDIALKDLGDKNIYLHQCLTSSDIILKDMTKEELKVKVAKQLSIINDANDEICSYVNDYIESLPYKVGDKVSCSRCDVCWIKSIVPETSCSGYTGEIEVRINPAKKDGTRSNREFVLWSTEIDSIKKIS